MATYNAGAVSDAVIAYQKPITLQQGRGLRDNPVASFEMNTGADVHLGIWHPYDMVRAGDGATGELWSFDVDGAVASVETPDFEDGFEYQLILDEVSAATPGGIVQISLYLETSATYDVGSAIFDNSNPAQYFSAVLTIHRPRDVSRIHIVDGSRYTSTDAGSGVTGGSLDGTAQKILRARINTTGPNLDLGRIRLLRRKVYE